MDNWEIKSNLVHSIEELIMITCNSTESEDLSPSGKYDDGEKYPYLQSLQEQT